MEYLATNFHKRKAQQILSMYNNADEILNKSKADGEEVLEDELEEVEKSDDIDDEDEEEVTEIDEVEKALSELGQPLIKGNLSSTYVK